ncbi:type IV toxin-antitoxin system AbiEi family antitoxin domain-containing protein [Leifsonia sp. AG29]|uniref:type IV toxin-antitoxin system AbiEi family antitoxin domain-containing protein n=1 Tax=Leifsonia sp. AG29 TaxID=2598860 RepID=UPI00131CF5FD|nr:type IV toxin-antitoxin system AbiEi family antitoxin domain-containing protein [Leifsonia sp. AG29]
MSLLSRMAAFGGAASTRQLRAAGVSDRELTAAVKDGRLLRPRRGVYASPSAPLDVIMALEVGARLTCLSAARSYGLWAGTDTRTHVLFPPHAGRAGKTGRDVVRHVRPQRPHSEVWRVGFIDCLTSVVRCADEETAIAVLDTALSVRRLTPQTLRRLFENEPARCRAVASRARSGSDSGVESILRQHLQSRGHQVEQQIVVHGVGRVDFRINGVLHVEVDGFGFHSSPEAFANDRRRDVALALQGARTVRFAARQVLDDPDDVVETIEALLAREEETAWRAAGAGYGG